MALGNMNFYQDGMGSAVDAFQKGQKHWSDLLTADVNRANTAANTTNTLERLGMDKEKHPLDLERMRTQNVGYGLDNEVKRAGIDKAEREKRQKTMDDFFKYMEQHDDVDGAIAYSGAPPKLGEAWKQMNPQQRAAMYEQFSKARTRDADRTNAEKHRQKLEEIKATGTEQRQTEQMRQEGMDRRERIKAEARIQAQRLVASLRTRPLTQDQFIAQLNQKRSELINNPAIPTESKQEMLSVVEQEINNAVLTKSMSSPQRPSLDLPGMTGGQVQMRPPQAPYPNQGAGALPPNNGGLTPPGMPPVPYPQQQPQQPQAGKLQGAAAENWITRAMQANPGMTREQVIAQGKSLGKL